MLKRLSPNKALQTDKGKLSCLLLTQSHSHASLPLPLIASVKRLEGKLVVQLRFLVLFYAGIFLCAQIAGAAEHKFP